MSEREYDSMRDYWESHWLAIQIKRERGDDYFVRQSSDQKLRLNSSSLEGATSLVRSDPAVQRIDKSLSGPLTSRAMGGPFVGHKDFCCSLDRIHVDAVPADQDAHFGAEPNSAGRGQ